MAAYLSQSRSRLLSQVIGHFEIDVVGRSWLFTGPTFVNDIS